MLTLLDFFVCRGRARVPLGWPQRFKCGALLSPPPPYSYQTGSMTGPVVCWRHDIFISCHVEHLPNRLRGECFEALKLNVPSIFVPRIHLTCCRFHVCLFVYLISVYFVQLPASRHPQSACLWHTSPLSSGLRRCARSCVAISVGAVDLNSGSPVCTSSTLAPSPLFSRTFLSLWIGKW